MELVRPNTTHLQSFVAALERGWSPDTTRVGRDQELLNRVAADPEAYLALTDDPLALGPRIHLPDGSQVARLPGPTRWMWDGEFASSIGLRWQLGTPELPPYCLGHIGYSVVPWRRRLGYATAALAGMLPVAREVGLQWADITTDPDNVGSQRVIEANGGQLLGRSLTLPAHGGGPILHYRFALDGA